MLPEAVRKAADEIVRSLTERHEVHEKLDAILDKAERKSQPTKYRRF